MNGRDKRVPPVYTTASSIPVLRSIDGRDERVSREDGQATRSAGSLVNSEDCKFPRDMSRRRDSMV